MPELACQEGDNGHTILARSQPAVSKRPARGPELSIVVPTFNERSNILDLISGIDDALGGIHWEIVFVDDNSPDGTAAFVRKIAQEDARIRCLHRFGRRGISSACVEGVLATSSEYVAVMHADRHGDEHALRPMIEILRSGDVDIAVAGSLGDGAEASGSRRGDPAASRLVTRAAALITHTPLDDPTSGLLMFRRETFIQALPKLSTVGPGLLLDIFASSPRKLNVAQVPCTPRPRANARGTQVPLVLWYSFLLLIDKFVGRRIPIRFVSFCLIGASGVIVHFAVLSLLFKGLETSFVAAQIGATITAMSSNFFLNNALTYGDQRLSGKALFTGWISFNLVCATGAIANVGIANWIYSNETFWVASALAGIVVGAVWNYAMSSIFTWRN